MKELREHNENMLRNILPSHVARHFLEKDRDNEVSPGWSGPEGVVLGGVQLDTLVLTSGRILLPSCEHRRMETMLPQSTRLPRLPCTMKSTQGLPGLRGLISKMALM